MYFQRSLKLPHRIPIFYGLPKVHKTPVTLQAVVSTTNSLLAVISVWLDYKMKDLLTLTKSYIKTSPAVINDLNHLVLPKGAKLFTADAISMYTNIDTDLGINSISSFLHANKDYLPQSFPTQLFLEVLKIVMQNNIFSFGETYWLQETGTAMGTPSACAYATLSYGHYENESILTNFQDNLLFYRRYIDDVFGMWSPNGNNPEQEWESFKDQLNKWGTLRWKIEEPSNHTTFLDLNIKIKDSFIAFSTFQKPLNLYLYLPPLSAHPFSCLKGLINGEMKRYWLQNDTKGFETLIAKFIKRLHERGHSIEQLSPLFQQAANMLEVRDRESIDHTTTDSPNLLYIHLAHHHNGIQSRTVKKYLKKRWNLIQSMIKLQSPSPIQGT